MTVSTLATKISYDGDGTANALAVPFPFWDETEIEVIEINLTTLVETIKAITADYTVSGGDGATGSVTPTAARPVTVRWLIRRTTSLTQGTDFPTGTRFPAEANEDALDRLTTISQELRAEIDRSIKISAADTPWTGEIPNATDRASMYLAFDANGEPVAASAPTDTAITTAFSETLLDDADAAEARTTLDAQEHVMTAVGDMVVGGASGAATRMAAGTSGMLIRVGGDNVPAAAYLQPGDLNSNFHMRGALWGFKLSNSSGTPNTDIDITAGVCRDAANGRFMQSIATITKRLNSDSWVVGTGNSGRAGSAALANDTWYHVFIIMVSSAYGVVDAGFDTDIDATNLLSTSSYAAYRRIGSIKTAVGSNNIVAFVQEGDEFLWATPPAITAASIDSTAEQMALIVPPDVKVGAIVNVYFLDANENVIVYLSSPDAADQAPSSSATPLGMLGILDGVGGNSVGSASNMQIRTNTSAEIRARSTGTGTVVNIATLGWLDSRGKNV